MDWRFAACVLVNVVAKRFGRELAYVTFPKARFVWCYPDRTTQWITGTLYGTDGKTFEMRIPANPRRLWKLPI